MAVIVLDRVGDLVDRLLARCAAAKIRPERVWILDPADPNWAVPWNPFGAPGNPHTIADGFVDAVERHSASWGVEIDYNLRAICRALVMAKKSPLEIETVFSSAALRSEIAGQVQDVYLRSFFDQFERLSNEQRLQRQTAIANKLHRFLAHPGLRRIICGKGTLPIHKLIDDPSAILLVALRKEELHSGADLLGDLAIQGVWNAALGRAKRPEHLRNSSTLILDEAQNFARGCLGEITAEGRRYRIRLLIAHQSQAQIEPKLGEVLRNNAAIRLLFNVGPVDAKALATELVSLDRARAISEIQGLQIGQAFLVRRGQRAVRIETPDCGREDHGPLAAFREAVQKLHATRCEDIDREMERRLTAPATDARRQVSKEEVRHVRKPRSIAS